MEERKIHAKIPGIMRLGIFWDFETARVSHYKINPFAKEVRNFMVGFHEDITFAAAATLKQLDRFVDTFSCGISNTSKKELVELMQDAKIESLPSPNERHYTIEMIKCNMRKFYDDHHEIGCWIVLITGGSEFNGEINNYKYRLRFNNFMLIYNDKKKGPLQKQDADHTINLAQNAVKLSYFMKLVNLDPSQKRAFLPKKRRRRRKKSDSSSQN